MPYATQQDMTDRFSEAELIQITNNTDLAAVTVDTTRLQSALQDADAEIDARLQPHYALPLASVPRLLVNAACDIARYRLYDDRATDQVTRRYEDAIKLIDRIGRGELQLGLDAAQQPTPSNAGAHVQGVPRTFGRDLLTDYRNGS